MPLKKQIRDTLGKKFEIISFEASPAPVILNACVQHKILQEFSSTEVDLSEAMRCVFMPFGLNAIILLLYTFKYLFIKLMTRYWKPDMSDIS